MREVTSYATGKTMISDSYALYHFGMSDTSWAARQPAVFSVRAGRKTVSARASDTVVMTRDEMIGVLASALSKESVIDVVCQVCRRDETPA